MRCPDWALLVAHRRRRGGAEPAGWRQALEHLDSCSRCRGEALQRDPSLLFRRLPAPVVGMAEVEEVRRGVAALRRAAAIDRARGRYRGWLQGAAAAALAAAFLWLAPGDPAPRAAGPSGAEIVTAGPPASSPGGTEALISELARMPVLEDLQSPDARVYQLREDGFSVVMIVDARLDV